jgi:hypothetical protein
MTSGVRWLTQLAMIAVIAAATGVGVVAVGSAGQNHELGTVFTLRATVFIAGIALALAVIAAPLVRGTRAAKRLRRESGTEVISARNSASLSRVLETTSSAPILNVVVDDDGLRLLDGSDGRLLGRLRWTEVAFVSTRQVPGYVYAPLALALGLRDGREASFRISAERWPQIALARPREVATTADNLERARSAAESDRL